MTARVVVVTPFSLHLSCGKPENVCFSYLNGNTMAGVVQITAVVGMVLF